VEILNLIIMGVMVIFNGIFAGYEIALAAVTIARLQILIRESRRGAKAALYMKENMEASLAAVQVAITLFGALAAAIGGVEASEGIKPFLLQLGFSSTAATILSLGCVVIPLTILTIMFGELVPKVFALRNKEWVCLLLSPMMRWFCFSAWPVVWFFETGVRNLIAWGESRWRPQIYHDVKREAIELQELRAYAAYARASRVIGEREERIILGAARLSSLTVREIMLPAEHICMLNIHSSLGDNLVTAHLEMHTRFPVTEKAGDPQAIIGYVNFKDLVALMRLSAPHDASLQAILRPTPSLNADMAVTACIERMIHEHTHIALVRNASNTVVGLVTLEDIIEELVGDIQDEYDRLPIHAIPSGWAWVVGGGLLISRFKELTNIDLTADPPAKLPEEGGLRTISDWIVGHCPETVRGGDIIERGNLRIVVRKVRRHKVLEAQITQISPEGQPVNTQGDS
jgi:putative hemolysin